MLVDSGTFAGCDDLVCVQALLPIACHLARYFEPGKQNGNNGPGL